MYKFEEIWWIIIIALAVLMFISDLCMWYKNKKEMSMETLYQILFGLTLGSVIGIVLAVLTSKEV